MALDKNILKTSIKSLLTDMLKRENTSIDEFAERLSAAIDLYVKSAEIVYQSGLTSPQGPVTGNFKGNLK